MRKVIAIVLSTVVFLVWWYGQEVSVTAEDAELCPAETENGDVNGDERLDITDPIYLLNHLFLGGPPPCALAGECDICLSPAQADLLSRLEFGQSVSGCYLLDVEFEEQLPSKGLVTLTADGGMILADTNDFGGADPLVLRGHSPTHGAWKKVEADQRKIALALLEFVYDQNGILIKVFKISGVAEFAPDFNEVSGSLTMDVFDPEADPMNDEPLRTYEGTFRGRRFGPQ